MLGTYNRVNVTIGSLDKNQKCSTTPRSIKHCKNHTKYLIFVDDGETMMSRLYACPCSKHLSLAVDHAWKYNLANQSHKNNISVKQK